MLPKAAPDWAFFLDIDGTLLEFADRPELVFVGPGLRRLLRNLHRASGGALALVSGRSLADMDALVDRLVASGELTLPFDLLGHSLGGNIVMLYAAARPQRVRRLINMEGFGLRAYPASHAPAHYTQWLDQVAKTGQRRVYPDMAGILDNPEAAYSRLNSLGAGLFGGNYGSSNSSGQSNQSDRGNSLMQTIDDLIGQFGGKNKEKTSR